MLNDDLSSGIDVDTDASLFEYGMLNDDLPSGIDVDTDASLFDANWLISEGHNLKFTAEYLFNIDVGDETDQCYSVVYGTTPWPFAQIRPSAQLRRGFCPNTRILLTQAHLAPSSVLTGALPGPFIRFFNQQVAIIT